MFEVGKFYKRRDGKRVVCLFTTDPFREGPDLYPVGVLAEGASEIGYVTPAGQSCHGYPSDLDIIGEAVECTQA